MRKSGDKCYQNTLKYLVLGIYFISYLFKSAMPVFANVVLPVDKSDFVEISDYLPVDVDIKYATCQNITGKKLYNTSSACLRKGTADKLKEVCTEIAKKGLHLKVWDAYRPPSVQFKLWDVCHSSNHIANPYKGFSNHSRGSAIDLTLVDSNNNELSMPSGFDDFSAKGDRDYSDVTPIQKANAEYLQEVMSRHGFRALKSEWWHFDDAEHYPVAKSANRNPEKPITIKNSPEKPTINLIHPLKPEITFYSSPLQSLGYNDEATLTLSAIGDNVLGTDPSFTYRGSFSDAYDKYGPGYFFSHVRDVLTKDDLTIANLETTLTNTNQKPDKSFQKAPFFFKGEPGYAHILREEGIEVVDLANNHSMDFLDTGYRDTISALSRANIDSFGYDRSCIVPKKGVKIGFLGYNPLGPLEEGVDIPALKAQIRADIAKLRKNCALVVVSFHWGKENAQQPNQLQVELGHWAIDLGADLVLGHHPHVIQPIEKYNNKYIVYSLGNFCFGGNPNLRNTVTLIFQESFVFQNGILKDSLPPQAIPCSVSSISGHNDYRPTILTGKEKSKVLQFIGLRNEK